MPLLKLDVGNAKFHLRQWLGRARRVVAPVRQPDGPVRRLHLGCGEIDQPGFVNIDGVSRPHVHYVQSITNLDRFADASFDFVYSSHTLEHFPRGKTVAILRRWRRVLKPGGRLCLSVPDFDVIVRIYLESDRSLRDALPPLFGGQDYPFNFHHTAFNAESLTALLLEAGFASVRAWRPGEDAEHSLPDWSGRAVRAGEREYPISLNLEATN